MQKFILLFNTVKYLKIKQIFFRLFYFARTKYRIVTHFKYTFLKGSTATSLELDESIENRYSCFLSGEFTVLNLSKKFHDNIDWNCSEHGKLWTYNLTYFEYLKEKEDVSFIHEFIDSIEIVKDGLEPFPISLRGISWIKFLTKFQIKDKKIDDSLYAQYYILLDYLEYHLLGNHLLENGFSLLFGSYYFKDDVLYGKAFRILKEELVEQILDDGGHFELSPMYHQIMLFRVLDCINLVENNSWKNQELLNFLTLKAEVMLGWLDNISYSNGNIPLLNDSSNHIAPTTTELLEYAQMLKITKKYTELSESGYKKIVKDSYECIVDVGSIGPSYIPGHAHADTFNFELRVGGKPFIVDSGLSTYETNETRFYERSSKAHNTIEVLEKNSSEVWGGFRVADRAEVVHIKESVDFIEATHNGYKKDNILHTRNWKFEKSKLILEDSLSQGSKALFRLHFHPSVTEREIREKIDYANFTLLHYAYAQEFNKREKAFLLEIEFEKDLKVEISI